MLLRLSKNERNQLRTLKPAQMKKTVVGIKGKFSDLDTFKLTVMIVT